MQLFRTRVIQVDQYNHPAESSRYTCWNNIAVIIVSLSRSTRESSRAPSSFCPFGSEAFPSFTFAFAVSCARLLPFFAYRIYVI